MTQECIHVMVSQSGVGVLAQEPEVSWSRSQKDKCSQASSLQLSSSSSSTCPARLTSPIRLGVAPFIPTLLSYWSSQAVLIAALQLLGTTLHVPCSLTTEVTPASAICRLSFAIHQCPEQPSVSGGGQESPVLSPGRLSISEAIFIDGDTSGGGRKIHR